MDRGAWWAAVHGAAKSRTFYGVAQSWTRLKRLSSSSTVSVARWLRIHLSMQEIQVQSLGWEDPLEKEMATHSSILA